MKKKNKEIRKRRYQVNLKYDFDKEPELIYLLDQTENKTALFKKLILEYYKDKVTIPF